MIYKYTYGRDVAETRDVINYLHTGGHVSQRASDVSCPAVSVADILERVHAPIQ